MEPMIDFKRPFVAMRKDPAWVRKILIAALVNLIPYVGMFAVSGWGLEYMRRVAWGDDEHLPEWKPFEPHLMRGFYAFVGILPLSMLLSVVTVPMSMSLVAPVMLIPVLGAERVWLAVALFAVLFVAMFASMLAAGWLIVPLTESIYAQIALYERLEAAFQYKDMWRRLRTSSPAMRRAWWYTVVLGIAIGIPLLLVAAAPLAAVAFLLQGDVSLGAALWVAVAFAVSSLAYLALSAASVVTGLATYHYWGRWARVAYGLGPEIERAPSVAVAAEPQPSPAEPEPAG